MVSLTEKYKQQQKELNKLTKKVSEMEDTVTTLKHDYSVLRSGLLDLRIARKGKQTRLGG